MNTQHTPGRLRAKGTRIYADGAVVDCIATMQVSNQALWDEDARRLVACWNACEGIDTEYLEGDESLPHYARRLMTQRDELLAALEKIAGFTLSQFMGPHDMALECVTVACDAIAKVKGGAA